MENNNKEIDLVELFIKVLLHIRKYKWIFIASIIIGFSIAYSVSKFSTKLYKSHITVITNDNKGVLISLFESLSEEKSPSNISRSLNISKDISKGIVKIEPELIVLENEKETEPLLLKIYVTVKNPANFKDVEKGLQFFAENNRHLKMLEQIDNSQRNELISYINIEINKLDSLRLKKDKNNNIYVDNSSTSKNEIINLFEKKQELEKANKLSKTFNIIKGFEKVNSPINSLLKLVLIYVFIVSFFGILLSLHLELRMLLKKKELL